MPLSVLRKLGFVSAEAPRAPGLVEAIEGRLAALDLGRATFVAAFAGLLARVAYADDEISEPEAIRIRELVAEHAGLAADEADAVALIARNKTVALAGADRHLLTRRFNEIATEEQRLQLIDCLYAVATADELVSHLEDREVRSIGAALMLPSSALLEVRSRYREKLEELQQLRKMRGE